jgi:transposase InsO family protein
MPWMETTSVTERREFVALHARHDLPMAELCRRFGISGKTGYKWLGRKDDLVDRSRRPLASPERTSDAMEAQVVELREMHSAWGGRKISRRLIDLGIEHVPKPSPVTHILRRHGLMTPRGTGQGDPYKRFEHPAPNALWQMDFKGDFPLNAGRCYPLTALDDHSRFNLVLQSLGGQGVALVRPQLQLAFERYGLPERINTDNGSPWGTPRVPGQSLSQLAIWLVRLGIRISFSRPGHPQTHGKEERFHRSLKAEVLNGRSFHDHAHTQSAFDRWREIYNHERPHDAIGLAVPASRYRPSTRPFPEILPPIEYGPDDTLATVDGCGAVAFKGRQLRVSSALKGQPIALRPRASEDGVYDLYYCHHRFAELDLREVVADD